MRLTQESTTDVEFPEKPQKDDSNFKKSTSSEFSTNEEAEIEPAGNTQPGSEDSGLVHPYSQVIVSHQKKRKSRRA